ncbi:MAG: hypothetical protein IPN81_08945 [Nitrosomonadales bacterium]|nr:hypothetical protein [Nitrosomonadales bacterium]
MPGRADQLGRPDRRRRRRAVCGPVTLGVMVKLGNAIEWVGVLYQAIEWVIGLVVCIAEWVDGEYRVVVEVIGLLVGLVTSAYAFEQSAQFVVNPGVLVGQGAADVVGPSRFGGRMYQSAPVGGGWGVGDAGQGPWVVGVGVCTRRSGPSVFGSLAPGVDPGARGDLANTGLA